MTTSMLRSSILALTAMLALAGCAESHGTCVGTCPDASVSDSGPVADGGRDSGPLITVDGGPSCLSRAPLEHRAASPTCDRVRGPGSTPDGPEGGPPSDCTTDAECTDGVNGRCTGNSHDGWRCTYDLCFADSECGADSSCECDGGFRSDANVCLPGNCRTDGDCASGFCSPTFGECGDYFGTIGYYCRTCDDECIDDSDCGGVPGGWGMPYCAFDPTRGHWACSSSHCAG